MNFIQTELAWAAGFYDGEGSCHISTKINKNKTRTYKQLIISVTQNNDLCLERFKSAVGNIGSIHGPHTKGGRWMYKYHAQSFETSQAVIGMLWKFLSQPKKNQIKRALLARKL